MPTSARRVGRGLADRAGDLIPFGDPYWYQDWASPYYNASHRKLRKFMRELVEEEVIPNISEWEADKKRALSSTSRPDASVPQEFIHKMGAKGILAGVRACALALSRLIAQSAATGSASTLATSRSPAASSPRSGMPSTVRLRLAGLTDRQTSSSSMRCRARAAAVCSGVSSAVSASVSRRSFASAPRR